MRLRIDAQQIGDLSAVRFVGEIVPAQEIGRVAEQPRSHRIALAGDAVGPGSGPADVSGHQGQIDNRLGRADALMRLVDAHRPPERHPLAPVNLFRELINLFERQTRFDFQPLIGELRHELGKRFKIVGRLLDEVAIDPAVLDQNPGDAVKQRLIAFGLERQMQRGVHRGFGHPRIDDDDLRRMRIPHDAFPHDGMGDAQVAAHEHDHVRLFKVGIGVGRGIESEGLFVSDDGGGHALPGVAVAVQHAHAEFGQRPKKRHFFRRDLPGAEEGDRFLAMLGLDLLEAIDERASSRYANPSAAVCRL